MKGRNTGTIVGLVCGLIIGGSTATMGINDMKEQLEETKDELGLYKGLNDQQQDIILKYKQVSGIEVSSITKTLHNEQLIIELEKRINELEEK
ncbi:hypothetical protein [Enterococcus phage vB_Efs30_KEN14]